MAAQRKQKEIENHLTRRAFEMFGEQWRTLFSLFASHNYFARVIVEGRVFFETKEQVDVSLASIARYAEQLANSKGGTNAAY